MGMCFIPLRLTLLTGLYPSRPRGYTITLMVAEANWLVTVKGTGVEKDVFPCGGSIIHKTPGNYCTPETVLAKHVSWMMMMMMIACEIFCRNLAMNQTLDVRNVWVTNS